MLRRIITATGADIVLSSSWRDMFAGLEPKEPDAHSLLQELAGRGLSIFDRTPLLGDRRPEEIMGWLADHEQVERIVILDDHDYNWEELRPYWIPIDDSTGLTDQDADKAISMRTRRSVFSAIEMGSAAGPTARTYHPPH